MKYAVCIVTYNRINLLKECLAAVLKQEPGFEKIIIVDNASTDGTDEYLSSFADDDAFIVLNQMENLGGSGGFKLAIEAAEKTDADYVLIIDDDAILCDDFMQAVDSYLIENPNAPAVSGSVSCKGRYQLEQRRNIANILFFIERNIPEKEYENPSFRYELSTFCGLVLKREVIQKIGLPRDDFFLWYDDTEYSMRLRPYGGIVNLNKAIINHKTNNAQASAGFYERMNWKTYYGHRNRFIMVTLHCPAVTVFMCRLEFSVFIIGAWLKGRKDIVSMLKESRRDAFAGKTGKNNNYLP